MKTLQLISHFVVIEILTLRSKFPEVWGVILLIAFGLAFYDYE